MDEKKTKAQLIKELGELRQRISRVDEEASLVGGVPLTNEERCQIIADYAYDWEFWRAPDGQLVYISPSCERITGYRAEEFMQNPDLLDAIIHPDDLFLLEQHRVLSKQDKSEHNVHQTDFRIVRKDGEVRWVGHTCRRIRRPDGTDLGRRVTNRDITGRKQEEEIRQESEARYRSLFENMLNGFAYCKMIFDGEYPQDFVYLNVNQAFESLTGLKEVVGKRVSEVIPGIREADPGLFEVCGRVALSGCPEVLETYVQALQMWFSISVYSPQREYFVAVFDVITARKQAEEALHESESRYRELVQNANSAIIRWKSDGSITFFNEYAQTFFGYRDDEVIGKHVDILLPETETTGRDLTTLVQDIVDHPEQFVNNINENICRDDHRVWVAWTNKPIYDETGQVTEILATGTDITARKQAEEKTAASKAHLEAALASMSDAVFISDSHGRLIVINDAFATFHRFESKDQCAKTLAEYPEIFDVFTPDGQLVPLEQWAIPRALRGEKGANIEYFLKRNDTGETWAGSYSFAPIRNEKGEIGGAVVVCRDVTERKRVEEVLRRSEQKFSVMFEKAAFSAVLSRLPDGAFVDVNEAFEKAFGYTKQEVVGKTSLELGINPDAENRARIAAELQAHKSVYNVELTLRTKSGEPRLFIVNLDLVNISGQEYILQTAQDITERKQAENALRQAHERLRRFVDSNIVGVVIANAAGDVIEANDYYLNFIGYTREELERKEVDWRAITPPEWLPADEKAIEELRQRGTCTPYEKEYIRRDGSRVPVFLADAILPGAEEEIAAFALDLTELKRAEERVRKLNHVYAVLSDVNQAIVRVQDTQTLYEQICRIAVEKGGFLMTWIGLLDPQTREVQPVAHAGVTGDYLENLHIVLDDSQYGHGPTAGAIRHRKHIVANDIEDDPHMAPWREQALRLGYRASAAFPLIVGTEVRGTLNLYAAESGFFDDEELKLLDEMAMDISFALEYTEQEAKRKLAEEQLRQSEAALKKAQQVSHVGSWTWYIQTGHLEWSDEMYRIFGIDKESFSGDLTEVIGHAIHPDDRAAVEQANLSVIRNKNPIPLEYHIVWPDGTIRAVWAEAGELVLDETSNPAILTGIVQDITERKLAEEALHKSEALFHSLAESLPQNVFTKDRHGRFTFANERYCATEGKSLQDILGKTDLDLHPSELAGKYQSDDQQVMGTGQLLDVVEEHQPLGGEKTYVQVIKAPLYDGKGSIAGILGIFWDVTEHKRAEEALRQAEEKYRTLVEQIPLVIYEAELGGPPLYISPQVERFTGFSLAEWLAEPHLWIEHLHPQDKERVLEENAYARSNCRGYVSEYRMIRKDGSLVWIHDEGWPVESTPKPSPVFRGIWQNITERKQAEEQVGQQLAELRRWYDLTLDRETRTLELKREINELLRRLNEPPQYPSAEE